MLRLTTEHKSRDAVENYTVCTMNIPAEMRSEDLLLKHFEDKFGCKPLRYASHSQSRLLDCVW